MPKGQSKKASRKHSPTFIILLLVKFFLIKIGQAPFRMLQFTIYNLQCIIRVLPKILHSTFSILHFAQGGRARGRPKKFRLSQKAKILIGLSTSLIFLFSYTTLLLTAAYELPTPSKLITPSEPLTTEFYDRNGKLLYRLYGEKNRTLIKLSEIPKVAVQATLAAEDRNFYHHFGIDPLAIIRAFYHNIRNESQEGASTLTQQLIKNSLLTPERTYTRKIKEIILALWTERIYSKDQILQMYFNEAPFGGSLVGIAAASQTYFGKSPSQLNLAESAFLAGLPASPTQFSPYGDQPELAKNRQKEILDRMIKEKYITKAQADEAFAQNLNIKPLENNIHAPHFVFYIRDQLAEKLGPRVVSQGGLKVYTTLDLGVQEGAEKIVKDEIDKLTSLNVKNGAAMVIDGQNGQILAMVGSRDYHYPEFGNFNVTLSLRQPGSSIKPITYATAFEKGFNPASLILDTPVTFRDEWGNAYSPVNYDNKFRGPVSLRQALGSSLNIPAVKLLATVGLDPVVQTARDLGITTFDHPESYGLALTLGGADVKMIEMMGVYDTFSQMGKLNKPTGILKVTSSEGKILDEYQNPAKQVLSPQIAYLITDILSDDSARQLAFGPNSLLNIPGYRVAVKTGTSDNKRDNWTFGYTPKFVVGVWVGNPDNTPMNPALTSGITGAAPIWNKIMHALLDGTKPIAFEKLSGLAEVNTAIPKAMVRITKDKDQTIFSDAFSSYATSSAQINPVQPNL